MSDLHEVSAHIVEVSATIGAAVVDPWHPPQAGDGAVRGDWSAYPSDSAWHPQRYDLSQWVQVAARRQPNRMPPLGLSGFAGTGKTEAAKYIESAWGYQRLHIAEPLRRMLASLLREYNYSDFEIERYLTGDLKEEVIPEFGATSRHMQITLGTEWMREQVDEGGWAKLWAYQARMTPHAAMNDSVRFPNEEDSIHGEKGFTILIVRPGTAPAKWKWRRLGPLIYRLTGKLWGAHDSERTDRLRPDFTIVNDGTKTELHNKIAAVMYAIQGRGRA